MNEIYLGVGFGQEGQEIPMASLGLKTWGRRIAYRQRLKQSYEIMQRCWGKRAAYMERGREKVAGCGWTSSC